MTCANCQALREEVGLLKRQLGQTVERDGLTKLMGALGLTLSQSRMILVLYYRGDWVETWRLTESSGITEASLRPQFWRIRNNLGREFVEAKWGVGYRLPAGSMQRVKAALATELDRTLPSDDPSPLGHFPYPTNAQVPATRDSLLDIYGASSP